LPHLEFLRLSRCSESLYNFPLEMRLPHLKRIYIANVCVSLLLLFQWIRVQLPSLEYISFVQTKFILDTFHRFTDTVGCQKTLKDITVQCCAIDESLLETILFDVLPNFPTVSFLRLWNNNIRSLRSLLGSPQYSEYDMYIRRFRGTCEYVSVPTCLFHYWKTRWHFFWARMHRSRIGAQPSRTEIN
jgi:hypothetical protein